MLQCRAGFSAGCSPGDDDCLCIFLHHSRFRAPHWTDCPLVPSPMLPSPLVTRASPRRREVGVGQSVQGRLRPLAASDLCELSVTARSSKTVALNLGGFSYPQSDTTLTAMHLACKGNRIAMACSFGDWRRRSLRCHAVIPKGVSLGSLRLFSEDAPNADPRCGRFAGGGGFRIADAGTTQFSDFRSVRPRLPAGPVVSRSAAHVQVQPGSALAGPLFRTWRKWQVVRPWRARRRGQVQCLGHRSMAASRDTSARVWPRTATRLVYSLA
jgi:hypothetical protein